LIQRQRIGEETSAHHPRRRTARFRLTALYCCLFLPSGVVLCVITYVLILLVARPTDTGHLVRTVTHHGSPGGGSVPHAGAGNHTVVTVTLPGHLMLDTNEFLVGASIVAVALVGASVLLGWIVAGRVLRPLRVMTSATRQISERNLHQRLALPGPDDELKALGDTIDGLLARLEAAFESQRRFVANASHELRTPLMLNQTILQVALADPDITLDSLRSACHEAVDAGKDHAQLIDALLTLARSQQGLEHREPVDLAAVVSDAVCAHGAAARARGLQLESALGDASVAGDARLIYTLVSNLVGNAIRYNISGGRVDVELAASPTEATLSVVNTGPAVSPDDVKRLLEPFQRAGPDRAATPAGYGLGLSIVADIAEAHGAKLDLEPRLGGGLIVTVTIPAIPASPAEAEESGRGGDHRADQPVHRRGQSRRPAVDDSADGVETYAGSLRSVAGGGKSPGVFG
jgi:signal transduction histidine kinase